MKEKSFRKLYEIFYILQIQKRIVSVETILGNTLHKIVIIAGIIRGKVFL
jgi:hypothetical protein